MNQRQAIKQATERYSDIVRTRSGWHYIDLEGLWWRPHGGSYGSVSLRRRRDIAVEALRLMFPMSGLDFLTTPEGEALFDAQVTIECLTSGSARGMLAAGVRHYRAALAAEVGP